MRRLLSDAWWRIAAHPDGTVRFRAIVRWEPRDLWVGVYWRNDEGFALYICAVPTVVLVIEFGAAAR